MKRKITIATSQFPVSQHIKKNLSFILKHIKSAKEQGADIVHFSESSLSGYAGIDFLDHKEFDIDLQYSSLKQIIELSARLKIWIIVGGQHHEEANSLPFNCLWVINGNGSIQHRYDKRFCTGDFGDQEHFYFKPGRESIQFSIKGIKCGLLICHEWRYPELYREQKRLGVEIIFQSWYDGNVSAQEYKEKGKELGSLIVGTVRGNAANNSLWMSASNTSKRESNFSSFVVQPNGKIFSQLKRNNTDLLISKIDLSSEFEDPSKHWRARAMDGILHSDI